MDDKKKLINNLPSLLEKIKQTPNGKILENIIKHINNIETNIDESKRRLLIDFDNYLISQNFLDELILYPFTDSLKSIIDSKEDIDIKTIKYISEYIMSRILKIEEDNINKSYDNDFDDYDEITEEIEDTSTKINDVLDFLKDLCKILTGFISNSNPSLKQLRININRSIIITIINTKNYLELLKLFIGMDKNIITLFKNFISDQRNDHLLKIYLKSYINITKEDIIEVLNKFINKEIKAGKKKKKGKRILKKYKK